VALDACDLGGVGDGVNEVEYRDMVRRHDKWRRRMRMAARNEVSKHLRAKYPSVFEELKKAERAQDHRAPGAIIWKRAEQALRKVSEEEYKFLMEVEMFRRQEAEGYKPLPTGGHHTGRHAKPQGDARRVDADAIFMETS
jgi:hypothetical protein